MEVYTIMTADQPVESLGFCPSVYPHHISWDPIVHRPIPPRELADTVRRRIDVLEILARLADEPNPPEEGEHGEI